jgi:hypothetical protein
VRFLVCQTGYSDLTLSVMKILRCPSSNSHIGAKVMPALLIKKPEEHRLFSSDNVCEVYRRLLAMANQSERLHLMASAGRPVSPVYRNEIGPASTVTSTEVG